MKEALRKKTPVVRVAALGVLEQMEDPGTLGEIERMFKDTASAVRLAAVEAAFKCGRERATASLIGCLKDTSWDVRLGAANALGSLRDRSAVEALCTMIEDPDRDVREGAVKALGKIDDKRAIPTLVVALIDPETAVRNTAGASLEKLDYRWFQEQASLLAVPRLQHAVQHSTDYWVRHSAIKVLERMKVKVEEQPVAEPVVAPVAVEEPKTHPAFPILADLLFDRDADFRLGAVSALGELGEGRARTLLAQSIRDPDVSVRRAAELALAALN
jgi:HEAT repeat protein